MATTYRVTTYAADGHGEPERVIASGLTWEEAVATADMGYGHWTPPERGVRGYHASEREGCGGRMIEREDR